MANQEPLPYTVYLVVEDADGNSVKQAFPEARSPMVSGPSNCGNSILMSAFIRAINALLRQHPTLAHLVPEE